MLIYKVLTGEQWAAARAGSLVEAPVDKADGYVHFSTAATLTGTLRKWFRGQEGCVLLAFESEDFATSLRWEKSRNDEFFPHVFGPVMSEAVVKVWQLELGDDDVPQLPFDLASTPARSPGAKPELLLDLEKS